MPDSLGTGDAEPDQARPSFTGFWKSSKDKQAAQNLTFVSSKLGQPSAQGEDDAQAEPFVEAKAKARRQQVRNAQRQHRQRKANYTKQLELDITKLRDDIAKVEQELESLRGQNGAIKAQLAQPAAVADPLPAHMAFSTSLAPQYTVSLDMSETLGTPAYRVSRASPGVSSSGDSSSGGGGDAGAGKATTATETISSTTTPASTVGTSLEDVAVMETALSEEQIDRVINFILALEHCCWNHIDKSAIEQNHHHHHHHHHHHKPASDCSDEKLNGHTLMATSLALQGAPPSILTHMEDLAGPASTACSAVAWPSRALTLTNLRRLAGTLNASAATELAPVQVWFELAGLYGVGVATDGTVLARLECAFAGEVRCVIFGAAVQRDVFEGVVKKVVGNLPRAWSPPARIVDVEEEGDEQVGLGGEEEEREGVDMVGMGMMRDAEADEEELREDMAAMGMDMDTDADMEMVLGGMSNQVPRGVGS
ncbi:hypothetical protein F4678DRAFT_450068 [Xylaria arbuscula]|nr:hypothetical protein F4678DRAFT_450068 [Xylaria arbuscula]